MFKRWYRIRPRQLEIDNILHGVLQDDDCDLLRYVIWELNVPTLMEVGTNSTTEMISKKALQSGCLHIVDKAIIIDALQKRGIKLWKAQQRTVAEFVLSCNGSELTRLKELIDTGGDYYNLYKLVYEDITAVGPRRDIQLHLREQALVERRVAKARQGTRGGVGIKILSDIDDTLYSSGGSFPAGCDKTFPKHRVYPGCLELFKALDWSYSDSETSCNLVFLSARPHVYKSFMEDHSYQKFRRLLADKRLHCLPTLLPGSLARGVWAALTYCFRKARAWQRVGEFKYTTFKKYAQLYLEYDYIFCGDNGQGDLLAGQLMLSKAVELSDSESDSTEGCIDPHPQVLAVLIHEVMPDEKALALDPPTSARGSLAWRERLRSQGILFYKTYLGAAAQVYENCPGLLSARDLREIGNQAIQHFEADMKYCLWTGEWSHFEDAMQEDWAYSVRLLQQAGLDLPRLVTVACRQHSSVSICDPDEVSDLSDGAEDKYFME